MTAVVVAMLVIVMVATVVLAAIGTYYHLEGSPAMQRKLRRWRFLALTRMDDWRDTLFHGLRVVRRALAQQLAEPAQQQNGPAAQAIRPVQRPIGPPPGPPAALVRASGAN